MDADFAPASVSKWESPPKWSIWPCVIRIRLDVGETESLMELVTDGFEAGEDLLVAVP